MCDIQKKDGERFTPSDSEQWLARDCKQVGEAGGIARKWAKPEGLQWKCCQIVFVSVLLIVFLLVIMRFYNYHTALRYTQPTILYTHAHLRA